MEYKIKPSSKFKKGLKNAVKRGLDVKKLNTVVNMLAKGEILPEIYCDHPLKGNRKDERECHITPDWLLVYQYSNNELLLYLLEIGSHSKLFKK